MTDKARLTAAFEIVVEHLKKNASTQSAKDNFYGSAERCAKALLETCKSDQEIKDRLDEIIKKTFPVEQNEKSPKALGMVTQGPITINSCCPHHLFPVRYSAYVSYVPKNGRVLGLSKLARICKALGERPVLHEQLASDVADVLHADGETSTSWPQLESEGSAAMLVGVHTCMACRGVSEDALTSVVELRGCFWDAGFEDKFVQGVQAIKTSAPFK